MSRRFRDLTGLSFLLTSELEALAQAQDAALDGLQKLRHECRDPSADLIEQAAHCGRCVALCTCSHVHLSAFPDSGLYTLGEGETRHTRTLAGTAGPFEQYSSTQSIDCDWIQPNRLVVAAPVFRSACLGYYHPAECPSFVPSARSMITGSQKLLASATVVCLSESGTAATST